MQQIGVIGCGVMGGGIVRNLLQKNYNVHIYDTEPVRLEDLRREGALPAGDAAALAAASDVIITSLPSPVIMQSVILNSVIPSAAPGAYILDMGTTDITTTKELNEHAAAAGVHFLDCPVSGGPDGAKNGTLSMMCGGKEDRFREVEPFMREMGSSLYYLGPSGSGQVVKMCNNLVVSGVITVLSEAFHTGETYGIPSSVLAEVLQSGSAATKAMEVFGENIVSETQDEVKFSLQHMAKDLSFLEDFTTNERISLLAAPVIKELYDQAADAGMGEMDSSAVSLMYKHEQQKG
ncbi:NAD(P)-dependent oxidoreductase [Salibacterium qingdaonense]|uniref:3-hydroxyisobutyrate dehydrogenase n=1 Tax=Salibacterium qingdaonense TaxID=266892 RepID=A0A1I4MES7_9BACI|nr:NAD(P)-dependent oxidoreductase [Salibacterium qingdaonense]SFM01784.1 3-hydroxyisobutyrate dehydrogenase [Salibacterium qingdaonense]